MESRDLVTLKKPIGFSTQARYSTCRCAHNMIYAQAIGPMMHLICAITTTQQSYTVC